MVHRDSTGNGAVGLRKAGLKDRIGRRVARGLLGRASSRSWPLFARRWRVFSKETNFRYAFLLLLGCAAITIIWRVARPDFLPELWAEMGGITLDVLFILIVFAFFEHRRLRANYADRQREAIDDYKRWDNPEAQIRIAGAIRRLNRAFVFDIDFSGIKMTDFSFAQHGIERLAGSSFYADHTFGMWTTEAVLTQVDFSHVDCGGVVFCADEYCTRYDRYIRRVRLSDCDFLHCDLPGAKFDGALLTWPEPPPPSHYVMTWVGDHDGDYDLDRETFGPFHEAELAGASFRGCKFVNADFRDAKNLLSADFLGATGLETAAFDCDSDRWAVLQNAGRADQSH